MPGASLFPVFNRLYDYQLCERLSEWQAEGLTLVAIIDRIDAEKGVRPSTSAVSRWLQGQCK